MQRRFSLLDLTMYFCKFAAGYANIARNFRFNNEEGSAFEKWEILIYDVENILAAQRNRMRVNFIAAGMIHPGPLQDFCRTWIHIQILQLSFTTRNYLFTNAVTYYIFFINSFFKQIQIIFFRIHNSLSRGKKFNESTKSAIMYDFCKKLLMLFNFCKKYISLKAPGFLSKVLGYPKSVFLS